MDNSFFYQRENCTFDLDIDRRHYLNFVFAAHIHAKLELVYVDEGEMDVVIDGCQMIVPKGCFCIILPWQVHSFVTRKFSHSTVIVFADHFAPGFAEDMSAFHGETQVFRAESDIKELFLRYLNSSSFPDKYIITGTLLALCHCFVNTCTLIPNTNRRKNPGFLKVFEYINSYLHENLSMHKVSDALGYSYYHFSRKFKTIVGESFHGFCKRQRLAKALTLLIDNKATISSIALDCGFSSIRSFNRIFRETMEMSPSEYRANYSSLKEGMRLLIEEDIEFLPYQDNNVIS